MCVICFACSFTSCTFDLLAIGIIFYGILRRDKDTNDLFVSVRDRKVSTTLPQVDLVIHIES